MNIEKLNYKKKKSQIYRNNRDLILIVAVTYQANIIVASLKGLFPRENFN